jgi:hypothetical protein
VPRRHSPRSYRRHRPSQAVVTLTHPAGGRRDFYLGPYGSAESKREYARLIAEWQAAGQCIPHTGPAPPDLAVNELLLCFWAHVQWYSRTPGGDPTPEVNGFRGRFPVRCRKCLVISGPVQGLSPIMAAVPSGTPRGVTPLPNSPQNPSPLRHRVPPAGACS